MSRAEYTPNELGRVKLVVIMFPSTALLSEFECPLYPRRRCSRPFCKYKHVEHVPKGNVSPVNAQGIGSHRVNSCETVVNQEDNACLLELEKIKKQIESVKCEVEQQQRKLSHYKTRKNDQHGVCLAVNKNKMATRDPNVNKYVLEKSRPLTDLEYDPCSNFSSGLLSSTLSECSVRPKKEKEIAQEQCEKRSSHRKGHMTKSSHYSEDSDDGTLVIDVPCLEVDPRKHKQIVQKSSPKVNPIGSPGLQCKDLTTDCGASVQKDLQANKQCVEETTKSPMKNSEEAKTGNSRPNTLRHFEKDRDVVASTGHLASLPVQDADLPVIRAGTGVGHSASSSHPKEAEKKPDIENVLDNLSACLDDLRHQSETSDHTNDLELVQKMNENSFDASDQKDDVEFSFLQDELQVQIESLEKALAEPIKNGQFPLLPVASLSYSQHTVAPKENVQLSDQTTSLYPLTKDTRSGQDTECVTSAYWPSVQNVQNEMCIPTLPTHSSITMQNLNGEPCNLPPVRCQEELLTISSSNQLVMLQKPLAEPSAGHDNHQAAPHAPADVVEIFSSSEEELNYSDLDLSEDDPMEECYKIFMEANKDGDSGIQVPSPVQASKMADADVKVKVESGQRKRMAHTPKFESTTKVKTQVIIPLRGEAPLMNAMPVRRPQQQQPIQRQLSALTTTVRGIQGPGPSGGHISKCSQLVSHSSSSQNACVNIIPMGATVQLPPNMHFILPQAHYVPVTVPMTVLPPPVVMPRAVHLTPAKPVPVKRKAKEKSDVGVKVPHNVRQRYVNLFVEEFLKTSATVPEAFEKALVEEKAVHDRSINRLKYMSVAVNALKRLKTQNTQNSLPSKGGTENTAKESKGNIALKAYALHGAGDSALYEGLKEYIMSDDMLRQNGYPFQHPDHAGCAIQYAEKKKAMADALKRICSRCGSTFSVNQTGKHTRKEECTYHYGRVVENRVPGGVESRYSCCEATAGSAGCQVFKLHVHDALNLSGFVSSAPSGSSEPCCPGVYAIDCEMCYTTQGLELARVTVVSSTLQVIYDTFVQPESEVIDYNTRFSGVTEKDVRGTSVRLKDVQTTLLSFISSNTILIGHELENDLCALKVLHGMVVDTSMVFPHRLGPPHKLELQHLTAEYLRRIIQESVDGHDTGENAKACMELMLWRVKEDSKVKRW